MKLSFDTIRILKNFATINDNLVVDVGSTIKTISEPKTILGVASVSESFPERFGVYDLNKFLSLVSLFNDPELEFMADHVVLKSPEKTCRVGYSEPSILTYPTKDLDLPETDAEVEISSDVFNEVLKAAGIFGFTKIRIESDGVSETTISAFDDQNPKGDNFRAGLDYQTEATFEIHFPIANLKLIPGDYKVSVSQKGISKWEYQSSTNPLNIHYFVAIDKSSKFNK